MVIYSLKNIFFAIIRENPACIDPLSPHPDSQPGQPVLVENYESGTPDDVLNPKKKIWEKLQPDFLVSSTGRAQWSGNDLITPSGPVTSAKIQNGVVR